MKNARLLGLLPGMSHAKLFIQSHSGERTEELLILNKKQIRVVTDMLTDYLNFERYLYWIGKVNSDICRFCSLDIHNFSTVIFFVGRDRASIGHVLANNSSTSFCIQKKGFSYNRNFKVTVPWGLPLPSDKK